MLVRVLLAALLVAALGGCAAPDAACGVRTDYYDITPIAQQGTTVLHWEFDNARRCNADSYGCTFCREGTCTVYLRREPDFRDVCSLAKLGHEVGHAMGGKHE